MKVINEASNGSIQGWKTAYENSNSSDDKMSIVRDALMFVLPPSGDSSDIVDKIISFGPTFVDRWIDAMKWDEIGNTKNIFIKLLSQPYITSSSEMFKNTNNFISIYNVYADNLLDDDYMNDDIYKKLITESRSYSYGIDDFKELFKIYNTIKDDDSVSDTRKNAGLKFVFLEDTKGNINGDINSLATIKEKLKVYNQYSSNRNDYFRDVSNKNNINIEKLNKNQINDLVNSMTDDQLNMFIDAINSRNT